MMVEAYEFSRGLKRLHGQELLDTWSHRGHGLDGKMMYNDRRMINENPVKVPFKNDLTAPREEYSQQQYLKRSSIVDNQPHKYQAMMFVQRRDAVEVSEDDESAKTSSSMD
ncbi:hypothetical protein CASFOL_039224 [Castilleja foliolosa]|uniref:Uncharacterized protein n=1 Tax=Castilleja foliolosa TaxID=1961234 RepID=A0ABD3BHF0_9LAMI